MEGIVALFTDKLDELKKLLAATDDLNRAFSFFLDHFGNDPAFIQCGKVAKHEMLKLVLKSVCDDLFEKQGKVTNLKLFNAAKTKFFHGLCQMGGKTASFFYFDEIEMGMICIMMGPAFGQMSYVRFTTTTVDADHAGRTVAPARITIQ